MYKQISPEERDLIALWHSTGISNIQIAKKLSRSVSTIGREIKRNLSGGHYVAISAQSKVDKRKVVARGRHPLKNKRIFAFVVRQIRRGWSPDIISGSLKKNNGNKSVISPETIYTFIYSTHPKAKVLKLWEYLPKHKRRRTRKDGRKSKKVAIPGRISIHDRPDKINKRLEFGHWEGDTMEGKAHKNGLNVEIERVTRLILAKKITNIDSNQTIQAQKDIFGNIPKLFRKSITLDNGKEFFFHQQLNTLGIQTYFTDPYSAWQKGSIENGISIIRRYLPKGTNLINISQQEIDDIIWEINSRPRKILNYFTPIEMYNSYIKGCTST